MPCKEENYAILGFKTILLKLYNNLQMSKNSLVYIIGITIEKYV